MDTVEPKPTPVKTHTLAYNPTVAMVCGAFGKTLEDLPAKSIVGSIADGTWRKEVEAIRQKYGDTLKRTGSVKKAKEAVRVDKNKLFAALWSGTFNARGDDKLKVYSGLLCADLDDLPAKDLPVLRGSLANDPHVCACFTSPTGTGLKVLFRVAGTAEQHRGNYLAVQKYQRVCMKVTGGRNNRASADLAGHKPSDFLKSAA